MIRKSIKITLIGIVWSYFFFYYANLLFLYLWGFDLFSATSWQKISIFWNNGGAIKKGQDYAFLLMLFALLPFWLWTWRLICRTDFLQILLWPFEAYNRHIIKKYGSSSGRRISLKNIGQSTSVEEKIKITQAAVKPNPEQDADKIRQAVKNKLSKAQTKI